MKPTFCHLLVFQMYFQINKIVDVVKRKQTVIKVDTTSRLFPFNALLGAGVKIKSTHVSAKTPEKELKIFFTSLFRSYSI